MGQDKVTKCPTIVIKHHVIPASGPKATDGVIRISINGGKAPYRIDWSLFDTQELSISGLAPYTYCVLVTDDDGCEEGECIEVGYKK